jgi:hypothetical protein
MSDCDDEFDGYSDGCDIDDDDGDSDEEYGDDDDVDEASDYIADDEQDEVAYDREQVDDCSVSAESYSAYEQEEETEAFVLEAAEDKVLEDYYGETYYLHGGAWKRIKEVSALKHRE